MAERSPGALRGVWAFLIYLSTFCMCLLGAGGVVLVILGLILMDVLVGTLTGDLKERLRRPRW